jgi:ATP-dependent helicase/nuclease subunit B
MTIYTIPSHVPFIPTLAAGLWRQAAQDPFQLSRMLVLLPNRRATRHLRDEFLRVTGGKAALLPRLMPLGDVDETELYFADPALELDIPPAIPSLRRHMLLTQLIATKDPELPLAQASQLATALAGLLDQVQTEGGDFSQLPHLVPAGDLAQHWQEVLRFLEIITHAWPEILAKEGGLDPAQRRNLVLQAQAAAWLASLPDHPIIAAGSTGSIPAVADLLTAIANLPQGQVILPGLDQALDATAWDAISDTHPQFNVKKWLEKAGVERAHVGVYSADLHDGNAISACAGMTPVSPRVRLLNETMRPAEVTEAWRSLDLAQVPATAFDGLQLIEAETQQEEAETIALRLRAVLEQPDQTAMLVTPDRALAIRVRSALQRWGIDVNDTAGTPLSDLPVGSFLRDVLRAASPAAGAIDYLALLKHPLAAAGLDPLRCRQWARQIEMKVWRGVRVADGLRVAARLLREQGDDLTYLAQWADQLQQCFAEICQGWRQPLALEIRIRQHIALAEALAAWDSKSGAEILWRGEAGESAALWLNDWQQAASGFAPLTGDDYLQLFQELARAVPVRPEAGQHPRLGIYGLLEARLLQADFVILAGLNEGSWPPLPPVDPWLSRPMKHQFNLALPERRIGLAAHDFVQLASAPHVMLTRARRVGTAPSVPSRFVLQLQAVAKAMGYALALQPATDWVGLARQLDQPPPALIAPSAPPEPVPPLAARPASLSVTEIGLLLRNPYAIYARHVLLLERLDEIDADVSAAERGTIIHAALERFLTQYKETWPDNALEQLLAIGQEIFAPFADRPQVQAFWWPRFVSIARWFIATESQRRRDGIACLQVEMSVRHHDKAHGFTLRGRADRVDRLPDGGLLVIDYKTGAVPTDKEIADGLEPQLPLLAMLLEQAGHGKATALEYWQLMGGETGGTIDPVKGDIAQLTQATAARLHDLLNFYADPASAYRAVPNPALQPRYDDYAHLARLAEWGRTGGDA